MQLLTQVEQAYLAAAALESLTEPWMLGASATAGGPGEKTAAELIDAVVAFRLGRGLQLRAIHYGSPGFIELIGVLNPLKTVADGVTENREINRKREETRLYDERERERKSAEHQQAMEDRRLREQKMRLADERERARIDIEKEEALARIFLTLVNQLPPDQRTAAVQELLQNFRRNTESISNDSRIKDLRMLETGEEAPSPAALDPSPPEEGRITPPPQRSSDERRA